MHQDVIIDLPDGLKLKGLLYVPPKADHLVIFVHGSGSSRFSPRNQYVADELAKRGLASCLLDLLTPEEEAEDEMTREFRFNIPLLAERLLGVSSWAKKKLPSFKQSYFGSSTGSTAALIAAADQGKEISSIVSRGGRPDLAKEVLHRVQAPTLLIVGGHDFEVIELNEFALSLLACEKEIAIVPKATHLFEEPGTLAQVAKLAGNWFKKH